MLEKAHFPHSLSACSDSQWGQASELSAASPHPTPAPPPGKPRVWTTGLQHHLLPSTATADASEPWLQICPASVILAASPALADCLGLYFLCSCWWNSVLPAGRSNSWSWLWDVPERTRPLNSGTLGFRAQQPHDQLNSTLSICTLQGSTKLGKGEKMILLFCKLKMSLMTRYIFNWISRYSGQSVVINHTSPTELP